MELFSKAVERLKKSKEFKDWKKKNPKCYLSSGFVIVEKEQGPWKAGYYDEKANKITSFLIADKIVVEGVEELFQKKKQKIYEIDFKKLDIELPQAIVIASNLQQEKYKDDLPMKIIAVIQNTQDYQMWNLIFITQKFNTLNIKVNSDDGKVMEHKITSIMDFRAKDQHPDK